MAAINMDVAKSSSRVLSMRQNRAEGDMERQRQKETFLLCVIVILFFISHY